MGSTYAGLKVWQIGLLIAFLASGFGGSYLVYRLISGPESAASDTPGESRQIIPVTRGDLVNDVSINGSVAYPNRETLSFGTQGTVGQLMVEEGQAIVEGQPLAVIDAESVATLEKAVVEAEVRLRDAEAALETANNPHTILDIVQAELDVADAEVYLDNAIAALADLLQPPAAAIAQAESLVATSRVSLSTAQEALSQLLSPDSQALAQAESRVANARVALDNTREALTKLLSPDDYDLKQAEAAVTSSRIALTEALDRLSLLVEPDAGLIAEAEAAVADSEAALADATEALDALLRPDAEVIAQAKSKLTEAKVAYDDAQSILRELEDGASDEEVTKLESQIDSAQTALTTAQLDLKLVSKEWDDEIESATEAVDTAREEYEDIFMKWLGIETNEADLGSSPETLLASWSVDLDSIFGSRSRPSDLGRRASGGGLPPDDQATVWDESVVYIWLAFSFAEVVVTCSDDATRTGRLCVSNEMDDAWEALVDALDTLDTVETDAAKALSKAEGEVDKATNGLNDARDPLIELLEKPDPLAIEEAQVRVEVALVSLESAQEALAETEEAADQIDVDLMEKRAALAATDLQEAKDRLAGLMAPDELDIESAGRQVELAETGLRDEEAKLAALTDPNPSDVEAAQKQVALAEAELQDAEVHLVALTQPDPLEVALKEKQVALAQADLDEAIDELAALTTPDLLDVAAKEKQVQVAEAALSDAMLDLDEMRAGPDPLDVALRQADVTAARASLDAAAAMLADATITAPWDGAVSAVSVEVGDSVNPNTVVIEIVDPTVVEIDGTVDEIDVLFIGEGARASVTMDALAGQTLAGRVVELGSVAEAQSGVVTYPISIQVLVPAQLELPEGLSAVATVILREERDVLLVPVDALYGSFDRPVVKVARNGTFVDREVVLGDSDGFWVVVESGVSEAELVLMESRETASEGVFGALRGLVGGGFGGPGRGFGGGSQRPPQR